MEIQTIQTGRTLDAHRLLSHTLYERQSRIRKTGLFFPLSTWSYTPLLPSHRKRKQTFRARQARARKKKKTDEIERPETRGTRVAHDLRYSGREARTTTHRYSYRVKKKFGFRCDNGGSTRTHNRQLFFHERSRKRRP